jgi:hypothetical protein
MLPSRGAAFSIAGGGSLRPLARLSFCARFRSDGFAHLCLRPAPPPALCPTLRPFPVD